MNLRIASLLCVVAAAGALSLCLPNTADTYFSLDRSKNADAPVHPTRAVMKHTRNTRTVPINANLMLRHIAPGSPDGPVDIHHQPWDWVEVYNRSHKPIPMAGYSLSDNPDRVRRYRFPSIVIPPQSGCRVWLSGFESMNSRYSLTPSDAIDARGWKPKRNDDRADRFTYMWFGFAPPRVPTDQLQWSVRIDEPGRYAVWLHAGAFGEEQARSQLQVSFQGHAFDIHLDRRKSLCDVQVLCPTSKDGYWDLSDGIHPLLCTVVEGESLINQVVVLRYGEPFGTGHQDLYAGFKLDQGGEFLGLFDPRGVVVDHVDTPSLQTGTMVGRDPQPGSHIRIQPVREAEGPEPYPSRPRFDIAGGRVEPGTQVTISCDNPRHTVRYTLNGELPDASSTPASASIPLLSNTVLRARAFDQSGQFGSVAEATYWVEDTSDLPVLSVIAEPEQLYDHSHGIMYNTSIRGTRSERRGHFTLIETNGLATASSGGLRIQGRSSRETSTKRNFRFVFRERYGEPFWPGTLFDGDGPPRSRSVVATGRYLVRNQLAHEMMDVANIRSPRRKAVRLFVNGVPYGLYLLVEDIQDPDYLQNVFGHLDLDVIKEKTYSPVKWGSMANFDRELGPYVTKGRETITFDIMSKLIDIDLLARWYAAVQFGGIDDNGQGYWVRDARAQGPPWSFINWDFDHAFTIGADRGWPKPSGYRSRLLLTLKNTSRTFQKDHYFPALQYMANHVLPLARLGERARELQAKYEPYLETEFDAHLNQHCFQQYIPDRRSFMDLYYHEQWTQLLHFLDTRMASVPWTMGIPHFGGPPLRVRIDFASLSSELAVDGWPARPGYAGYYFPTTQLSVRWKNPAQARPLDFEINGATQTRTELRTNVTENLVIRIRDTGI